MSKFKAFLVRRETGKRGVIDNSLLPVKADALQTLSKNFFLCTGNPGHESSVWTSLWHRQELKPPQLSDPPVPLSSLGPWLDLLQFIWVSCSEEPRREEDKHLPGCAAGTFSRQPNCCSLGASIVSNRTSGSSSAKLLPTWAPQTHLCLGSPLWRTNRRGLTRHVS